MGWDFVRGATRERVMEKRLQPRDVTGGHPTVIVHCERGDTLWSVRETTYDDGRPPERHIACDIVDYCAFGWGYKSLTEASHPYDVTCPLEYLDLVPETFPEWRRAVCEHHRHAQVQVGDRVQLVNYDVPEIKVTCLDSLCGTYGPTLYRSIPWRCLGPLLPQVVASVSTPRPCVTPVMTPSPVEPWRVSGGA
jgi:hypothetical protein